jgi:hypothetical protein
LSLGPKPGFPEYFENTVLETVDVIGIDYKVISGYGLVVNLENTGRDDGIPAAVRETVMRNAVVFGVGSALTEGAMGNLTASQLLGDPRNAVVRVDAYIPPGALKGQRVDVRVSALDTNTTTSLARGELWRTELHSGNITPQNPGERVNLAGQARGRLSVNPVYALEDPMQVKSDPSAQTSLRTGYIQDGGIFDENRVIVLRLRTPSWRTSRAVEKRINLHFGAPVAAAQDEGRVYLAIPDKYQGDWAHFVGVATTLFFSTDKAYAVGRAQDLIAAAQSPTLDPVNLEGISYAWEALGHTVVPLLVPLFSDPNPAVAFWSARAAAFNEEQAAVDTLVRIAAEEDHPFAVAAAQTLGKLRPNSALIRSVRALLDVSAPEVRIAAYRSLMQLGDFTLIGGDSTKTGAITSTAVGEKVYGKQFYIDQVPSKAPPIIWASRVGTPRIAIIGSIPTLKAPMLSTAFGNRLSISVPEPGRPATVYYRPANDFNTSLVIRPDMLELAAALGGEVAPGNVPMRLCYGDVLAVLKQICDGGLAVANGEPVPLILEDMVADLVDEAPNIPGLENMQAGDVTVVPDSAVPTAPGGQGAGVPMSSGLE